MSFKIESHPSFSHQSKGKKLPFSPTKTDKKALAVTNQVLGKSSAIWYTNSTEPLLALNEKLSVTGRLPANTVHVTSAALETP